MTNNSNQKLADHPVLLLSTCLAIGIVFGRWTDVDMSVIAGTGVALLFIVTRGALVQRVAMLAVFGAGVALIMSWDNAPADAPETGDRNFTALVEVRETDAVQPKTVRYIADILSIDGAPAHGRVRWKVQRAAMRDMALPGDVFMLQSAKFRPPRGFHNIDMWDYERYLADRGIAGDIFTGSKTKPVLIDSRPHWRRPFEIVKNFMRRNLYFAEPDTESVAVALVTGDQGLVSPELRETYSRAGTAHILSVSGLHLGFVAAACYYIARLALFGVIYTTRYSWASAGVPMRLAAFIAMIVTIAYGLITGPAYASERASIMTAVYLLAIVFGRGSDFYGAFGAALGIMLLRSPTALFDLGFQLSFTAVFFIVLFMEQFYKPAFMPEDPLLNIAPTTMTKLLRSAPLITSATAVSIFATIGSAPLVAYYFNVVQLYGVFSNILLTPVASFATPWGLLFSSGVWTWGTWITGRAVELISIVSTWVAELPYSYVYVPSIPVSVIVFYYAIAGVYFLAKPGATKKIAMTVCGVSLLAVTLYRPVCSAFDRDLMIRFIDVGQGDCSATFWSNGGALIIDGGPRFLTFDPGRSIVAPVVWNMQRTGLTAMFATHEDMDHIGGLPGLADRITPAQLFDNGAPTNYRDMLALRIRQMENGAYKPIRQDAQIDFGDGLSVKVLNPPPGKPPYKTDSNNLSLVLMMTYGDTRILFMGDAGVEVERWLLDTGADIKADVLKVGHHGSNHSSSPEFLRATGARTAVISAGYKNHYRLPGEKTLENLRQAGIRVFRTDLDGEIVMRSDGNRIRWETWGMRRWATRNYRR